MKNYNKPEIYVEKFKFEDILTLSNISAPLKLTTETDGAFTWTNEMPKD